MKANKAILPADTPLVPNAETIEAIKAVRAGDLETVGDLNALIADLNSDE